MAWTSKKFLPSGLFLGSLKFEPLKRLANGFEKPPDFFSSTAGGSSFFLPKSKNEKIGAGAIAAAELEDAIDAVATLDLMPASLAPKADPPILFGAFEVIPLSAKDFLRIRSLNGKKLPPAVVAYMTMPEVYLGPI